ncbi:hypothetical protein GCM10027048_44190 [Hymenobacter coalescens]
MRLPYCLLPATALLGAACWLTSCQPDSARSEQAAAAAPAAQVADTAAAPLTAPAPAPAAADAAPVKIVAVSAAGGTEAEGRFVLPEVQLPDAAVARRLNQAIVAASFDDEELQRLPARQWSAAGASS